MSPETYDAARRVVAAGSAAGVTVGAAESCTGGLVCGAITAVPGSSEVLRGGVVSYDPDIKRDVLGVSRDIIDDPEVGVVSRACAEAMAVGARRVLSCDVAVSVTGIAGPGGAEPGKPVGTVWLGLADAHGVRSSCSHFTGSRAEVREQAVLRALELLCEGIAETSSGSVLHKATF